jgi:CubicO group peptidase (beta-lactamase class C family)
VTFCSPDLVSITPPCTKLVQRQTRAQRATATGLARSGTNWDFNTLGTIYERAARSSIFDAFEREIARPIGMQDYQRTDGSYFTD